MITLKTKFETARGYGGAVQLEYTQVKRCGDVCLYQRTKNGNFVDYEVIKPTIVKAGTQIFNEIVTEDYEKYPSSELWGLNGFTYTNIIPANKRFMELSEGKGEVIEVVHEVNTSVEDAIGGEVNNDTTEETPIKRRGRAKGNRPALVIPNKDKFAMIDLEAANPAPWNKPLIYLEIKQQLADGKIKEAGVVEKADGQKGKPAKLYSLV